MVGAAKIKICGLTRLADIEAVNAVRPDYIGFVFAESRRRVTPEKAAELRAALDKNTCAVGVFVDAPVEEIVALVRGGVIDAVQLHGTEDEKFILDLKKNFGSGSDTTRTDFSVSVIKAVSVQKAGDAQAWENSAADYLLLDHKGGGTGQAFDWDLIGEVKKPFFLAGGLNSENVAAAVKKVKPFAVDVSSGVEISPGVKCAEKIRKFFQVVSDTNRVKLKTVTSPEVICKQYGNADNLGVRIRIKKQFGTGKRGWADFLLEHLELKPRHRVLELGCGNAVFWRAVAAKLPTEIKLTLSDFSAGMLDAAKNNTLGLGFEYTEIDAQNLPYPNNSFDVVIANYMLYHVPDVERALREIARVLKPDGRFCAATFGKNNLKEVTEIFSGFDKNADAVLNDMTEVFGLENGGAALEKYFDSVKLKKYENDLHITAPDALKEYLLSYRGMGNLGELLSGDKTTQFYAYVENIFSARGYFDITQEEGLFVSSSPKINLSGGQNMTKKGRFGQFGGQYVPETLMGNLHELEKAYTHYKNDKGFQVELLDLLKNYAGRPSLLYFAEKMTSDLGGAKIYLKREDLNHTGSHKINNVLGQVLLAKKMGKTRVIAETGAGQHGVATATAAALTGLECEIFMGKEDTERQALNVFRMELLGANVTTVTSGTMTLKDAVNETMREWVSRVDDTHYVLGSVMGPHPFPMMVRDFQKIIGIEIREQLLQAEGKLPDAVVACIGGGSNAIGAFYDFIGDESVRLIGCEAAGLGVDTPKNAATITLGTVGIFHGMKSYFCQDEYGQIAPVHSISAGLDYPGIGPEHAHLSDIKRAEYAAVTDDEAVEAFEYLSRVEGVIPAIESAHAVAYTRKIAPTMSANQIIVVNLSGRGDKDVAAIARYKGAEIHE